MKRPAMRIDVGRRWLREATWLLEAEVGGAGRADLDVLRAPVDLVVRSRNLTESLPDEPVLPLLDALASAVSDLASGRRAKALIAFREAPWELALVRDGDDVRLTLYELTAPARVVAEDLVVPLPAVRRAVARALDAAMTGVRGAVPSHAADELLAVLRGARQRLEAGLAPARPRQQPVDRAPIMVETCAARFALNTRLDDARDDLLAYDGEHPHDRHALLSPGTIELVVAQGPTLRLTGRPLAMIEAAGTALVRLMQAPWPARDELVRTPTGRWVLELDPPRATLGHVDPDGARRVVDFDASDLVTAWCDHIVDVLGACLRANPLLEANELVVEAIDAAEALRAHTRRALAPMSDPLAAVPASHRARLEAWPSAAPRPASITRDLRRLRYDRAWSVTRRGMRRRVPSAGPGHRLLVSDEALASVRLSDGAVVWTTEGEPRRMRTARVGVDRLVTADDGGDLVERDLASGAVLRHWSTSRRVRRVDGAIWCRSSLPMDLVVSVGDGRVLALGVGDRPVWSATIGTSARRALAVCSDLVVAVSRDGGVVALRPEGGERAWTERVDYDDVQLVAGRRHALVTGASPLEGRGFVGILDGATGRWRLRVDDAFDVHGVAVDEASAVVLLADPATESRNLCTFALDAGTAGPRVAFSSAGAASARARLALCGPRVVISEPRRVSARALAAPGEMLWSVDLDGFGRPAPRVAAWAGSSPLVAWADEEALVVVSATTGAELTRIDAFWEQLDGLTFSDDGGLLVVERRTHRERTVHRLSIAGLLAVVL